MFQGAMSAIITPFSRGRIDEKAFRRLVEYQIKGGIDGIVPCGTTGESATLTYEEHERIIEVTLDAVKGRVPVIAGTGSNSTDETIAFTRHAERVGADAALLISPYYNKPTQEGLYRHYRAVAEAVSIPLVLYNVPGRTSLNMLPDTVARLSEFKNIIGIKEASCSLQQVSEVIEKARRGFMVLSGDDFITLPMLAVGARGTISVTSNIVPGEVAKMCGAQREGNTKKALRLHYKMQPLNRALFLETNPIPVKSALAMMGAIKEEYRLPLVKMESGRRRALGRALKEYGLIG